MLATYFAGKTEGGHSIKIGRKGYKKRFYIDSWLSRKDVHQSTRPEPSANRKHTLQRGEPSTEPAVAMRDRSPPGQQYHHDAKTLKRRPQEGRDAKRRRRHPSQKRNKVFTQSSLPREEGYLNNALRRVTSTMPSGGLPHPTDAPPPAGFQSCQRQDCHSTNHLRQVADPSRLCHAARRLPR